MEIIHTKTGVIETVEIREARSEDIRKLTKARYAFNWLKESKTGKIFVLNIQGQSDILGVVSIKTVPHEFRIEIIVLTSSKENVGETKLYAGIAGCLLAYICRLSVSLFGENACVSLVPKTKLREHYITQYGMIDAGWQVYVEGSSLLNLMNKYLRYEG